MQYQIPRGTTAVQGIPIGRLANLESRVSKLESTSSSGYQVPTGTVNGTNQIFVFTLAPNVIVSDGVVFNKIQSDGTVMWTGTTTVTLAIAPNQNIFSIA